MLKFISDFNYADFLSFRIIRINKVHAEKNNYVGRFFSIPYSAYISRVFNFANFVNLESFAKLFRRNISHFEVEPHWRRIEQRIREIISTNFLKTAIRENLDPRNISAIR